MFLEKYIADLLYRYECVTIPDFGAFLTQYQSTKINIDESTFYPPTKSVSFNAQLTANDGLLAKYIADVEHISYENALKNIEDVVLLWKKRLKKNKTIQLKNIGDLWVNTEHKIQFKPENKTNYLTTSFGLTSFVSAEIKRVITKEKTAVLAITAKNKRQSYLKYAALFLIGLSVASTSYIGIEDYRQEQLKIAETTAQQKVEETIQQATFFDTKPLELPAINLTVTKESAKYHVIAGAFRIATNADKKVNQLLQKGYAAKRLGKNKYGLHMIAYNSFSSSSDALHFLRMIRRTETPEAWLFISK